MVVKTNDTNNDNDSAATTVVSGMDWGGTIWNFLLSLGCGSLVTFWFYPVSSMAFFRSLGLLVGLSALFAGCRYVVVLSPDGIRFSLCRAWVLPLYRRTYWLDADIAFYQSFEAEAPEGLCFQQPFPELGREFESACFGPSGDQERLGLLRDRLLSVLDSLRQGVPPLPSGLRHPILGPLSASLDIAGAKRSGQGRLHEVASKREFTFGGISIPVGSTFFFNEDFFQEGRFIDTRRDDFLVKVVLGAPTMIAGLPSVAGASLMFYPNGRLSSLRGAFGEDVEIDGNWVDGRDVLSFGEDGALSGFTLSRKGRAGGRVIPRGSRFFRYPGDSVLPARLTCWLGGEIVLPDITLKAGESMTLSQDGETITGISPKADIQIPGQTIRAGIVPIPLRRDGHIDIAKCRKFGIVEENPAMA